MRDVHTRSLSSLFGCIATILIISAAFAGCKNNEAVEAQVLPSPPHLLTLTVQPTIQVTTQATIQPTAEPSLMPTPTFELLSPDYLNFDIKAEPNELPLELQIPDLKVNAPMLGVGLTSGNIMDAPKGPIGDPVWHTAFWYRGSGIPGDSGTATIAGHVNDPLGRTEIFANLGDLKRGDVIIIHSTTSNIDIYFNVNRVEVYSIQESSDPAVLAQIFGDGPVSGKGPQPAPDGLSHLTLITCSGNIENGAFDHHTIVYATRVK
ncbi:MAG: hypothetical protein CVU39_14460 [Chloroflexi bacterium HGW-Chloroflexi-10]|nr:MAG: hypothetical protein CVU39_14460 [Chloroflexi bacterium HGW-Chloroflexi-10]